MPNSHFIVHIIHCFAIHIESNLRISLLPIELHNRERALLKEAARQMGGRVSIWWSQPFGCD
jgi:hypothetical protein